MEYFDLIKMIIAGIVIIVAVIILAIWKKKKAKIKGISIGPLSVDIYEDEKTTEEIEILSVPIAGCANEQLSPPLRIRLKDINGCPVLNKKARIEIYDENGLVSSKCYCGKSSQISDNNGYIEFNDLVLKKTGRICMLIIADTLEEKTEDIDILPPGLNVDFWNEPIGSPQYEEKLNRALRLSHNP